NSNGTFNWAMQWPETTLETRPFLQAFLPGNRDDQARRDEGSIQEALVLMNDNMVMSKLGATGTTLLAKALTGDNSSLVDTLYLNILSRPATDSEKQAAIKLIQSGNRNQKAQEVMWTLYNKVDFIFNY